MPVFIKNFTVYFVFANNKPYYLIQSFIKAKRVGRSQPLRLSKLDTNGNEHIAPKLKELREIREIEMMKICVNPRKYYCYSKNNSYDDAHNKCHNVSFHNMYLHYTNGFSP